MDFSIFIKKLVRICLMGGILSYSGYQNQSYAQIPENVKKTKVSSQNYLSAFSSLMDAPDSVLIYRQQDSILYTIQLCTLDYPIQDHFFQGTYKIKIIPIGELYRYIFSQYSTLEKARQELKQIQQYYPKAYIREYREGKLGLAIDMNIEQTE